MKNAISEALINLARIGGSLDSDSLEALVNRLSSPGRVMVHGAGSEGLVLQGFAQSLQHLGRDVTFHGHVLALPIGPGDLFLTSNFGGNGSVTQAIWSQVRKSGAEIITFTQDPEGKAARAADRAILLPSAGVSAQGAGALGRSALYLVALHLLTMVIIDRLSEELGVSAAEMRARQANID